MTDRSDWDSGIAPASPKRRPRPTSSDAANPGAQSITVAVPAEVLERLDAIEASVDRLRDELRSLGTATDLDRVRSSLDLLAGRLGELLGGPSMTELMDRIDELERNLGDQPTGAKRRWR